ncbi:hypothetical protein F5X99DRAFT_77064 [Biscogniauxia marginata]|nr:hypothetical protein F5X99DRAFT_77064 [Biscogniauxia marginata]
MISRHLGFTSPFLFGFSGSLGKNPLGHHTKHGVLGFLVDFFLSNVQVLRMTTDTITITMIMGYGFIHGLGIVCLFFFSSSGGSKWISKSVHTQKKGKKIRTTEAAAASAAAAARTRQNIVIQSMNEWRAKKGGGKTFSYLLSYQSNDCVLQLLRVCNQP